MTIGEKIKALRAKKDISQQELAKVIGVSDQAVSAWENNKKVPRMGSVEKLATYFDVPKSFLVEDSIGLNEAALPAAVTAAAGLVAGGPVLASVLGILSAAGVLANTLDSHGDKTKGESVPFLMTKDDNEKSLLQIYRSASSEGRRVMMATARGILAATNERRRSEANQMPLWSDDD